MGHLISGCGGHVSTSLLCSIFQLLLSSLSAKSFCPFKHYVDLMFLETCHGRSLMVYREEGHQTWIKTDSRLGCFVGCCTLL